MKENICTIPINDLFLPRQGCPICSMEKMLEETYVEFSVGDAMMEPSVRIEMNKKGFCRRHFQQMLQAGKKLPNALIIQSHLQEIIDNIMPEKCPAKPDKKALEKITELEGSCYVCHRIDKDLRHLTATVFAEYQRSREFRELYKSQPYICLNHYALIMKLAGGKGGVASKIMPEFHRDTYRLTQSYLMRLKEDITKLCSMFDYRNAGGDFGNSKDAIERSVEFLRR